MRLYAPWLAAACAASATAATAQTDNVAFNGTVADSCTVLTNSDGTLGLSSDSTVLASTETGGAAGAVTVTTNNSTFSVSIDAITAFTTGPADADTNTVFASLYGASGATTASGVSGATATILGLGVTSLSVDASATKSVGTFSAGSYQLTATVRCTP